MEKTTTAELNRISAAISEQLCEIEKQMKVKKLKSRGGSWVGWKVFVCCCCCFLALPAVAQQFHSPTEYCRAVGTIDKPGARYVGPKLPAWMARDLNLKPNQGKLMEWRCANGKVLACVYGANIPCDAKAKTNETPTQPILEYCRQNPASDFVPMVVTGHDTAVSWACTNGGPRVIGSSSVDQQGYATAFWKAVNP